MKKNIIMLLAATLLIVAGCKKDDNKDNTNGEKMTFTSNLGGGAKTAITGKDMLWTTGDQIIINGETFDSEIFDDGKLAKFTGNVVEPVYEAFYPIGIYKSENNYELPATQTYSGNTLSGVNPMYARSTSTSLDFHNICALMKLDLTGTDIVTRIVAQADQPLSGAFCIAGDETNGYYAQLDSKDGAATVTLDCGDGVLLNAATPTTFYMALPQGDFTHLTFMVENKEGKTTVAKQLALCPLQAGHLSNEVARVTFAAFNALSGVFTVSGNDTPDNPADDKKIRFSQGNLQYVNGIWKFAEHQYDCLGAYSETAWDLFGWSTGNTNYGMSISQNINDYSGIFVDWGTIIDKQGTWYTLSHDEWVWLLGPYNPFSDEEPAPEVIPGITCRTSSSVDGVENARFAWVTVNDGTTTVNGMLVFPDQFTWNVSMGIAPANNINSYYATGGMIIPQYTTYNYNSTQFAAMEEAGCVFLPAAGNRIGDYVRYFSSNGSYWSSAYDSSSPVRHLLFSNRSLSTYNHEDRCLGHSVRLVRSAN